MVFEVQNILILVKSIYQNFYFCGECFLCPCDVPIGHLVILWLVLIGGFFSTRVPFSCFGVRVCMYLMKIHCGDTLFSFLPLKRADFPPSG